MQFTEYPWFKSLDDKLAIAQQNQRLPHGLLIVSAAQTGKKDYAEKLAATMLCQRPQQMRPCGQCKSCHLLRAQSHPDYYLIDLLVDNKGKAKKTIGIDQIRELNQKLVDTAQMGGWRVAVVRSVTRMTIAAFNALLKTLEEPGDNTLLILLADNQQKVPATIRSRCQLVSPELSSQITQSWLEQQTGAAETEIQAALKACFNAPLAARDYLLEGGEIARQSLFKGLDQVFFNQLAPADFLAKSEIELQELSLIMASYFYQLKLTALTAKETSNYQCVPEKLPFQLYNKLIEFNRCQHAGSNLQAKLQLEAILIQWFEIGKKINQHSNSYKR